MVQFTNVLYYLMDGWVILRDKGGVYVEEFSDESERWAEVSAELERPGWVCEINPVQFREEWQRLPDCLVAITSPKGNNDDAKKAGGAGTAQGANGAG